VGPRAGRDGAQRAARAQLGGRVRLRGRPARAFRGAPRVPRRDGGPPRAVPGYRAGPGKAPALLRRSKASAPALVYFITHAGRAEPPRSASATPAGERIAQHRRAGWQLVAGIPGRRRRGRGDRGRCPRLVARPARPAGVPQPRPDAPQDGWTETVAAGRIDLSATVARVCELALLPESRPAASSA
jgi:hypothetical protein